MADDERRAKIEAVARIVRDESPYAVKHSTATRIAERAIAALARCRALDRVRDARGDDEGAKRIVEWLRSVKSPLVAPNEDAPKLWLAADYIEREFITRSPQALPTDDDPPIGFGDMIDAGPGPRSPQGEDHEAEIARGDALMAREFEAVDHDAAVQALRDSLWSTWGAGRQTTDWPSDAQLRAALDAVLACVSPVP